MFGIWRTLLAIEVVAYHILPLPLIGRYAVFSFFVLSGFLMTEIMQRAYGYTPGGSVRYLANRALRLLPSYWFAAAVTLVLIAGYGARDVVNYHSAMTVPQSALQWAENATMVFPDLFPRTIEPRLVPPTWALTVEICFYILIGIGASRTKVTTWVWLICSCAYVLVTRLLYPGGGYLFDAIPAGSLPFSVGALAWHYRDDICLRLNRLRVSDARMLIVGRWVLWGAIVLLQTQTGWKWLEILGNWLNIAISAFIVCKLFTAKGGQSLHRIDKAVGDLSYPVYLLHLQMGFLAAMILSGQPTRTGPAIFALGLLLTIVLGAASARLIDPAVEHLRRRIKAR